MNEWFKKAKLGLFIHYGIYAVKGVAESWSFYNGKISYEDYMAQAEGFSASKLDMKNWAELAVEAGAKYAVFTTKHHDGMALFDTKYSDLNILKQTPVKRDLVAEYVDAFREKGIKIGLYYSLIDWSHPDYPSVYQGGVIPEDKSQCNHFSSPKDGVQDEKRWENFLEFDRNQLKELLTNYGNVDLLWFDGDWERSAEQWGLPEFKDYLLSFNKDIIINSRLAGYGDYLTPEQGLPVKRPEGEWEFCTTINDSWGYQQDDNHYKSPGQVIRIFVDTITMGGNLLLDIGPREDGSVDERQINVLRELGSFIRENEEAIYDTQAGLPFNYFAGGSTVSEDGKTLYLFVYDIPREAICIKGLCNKIESVKILSTGKELTHDVQGGAAWFNIPGLTWISLNPADCGKYMTVLKVELDSPLTLYSGEGAVISQN